MDPLDYVVDADTRRVPLTQGLFALVDAADFAFLMERKCHAVWVGDRFYARSRGMYIHRLLMGNPAGMEIDHINGDTLDNRRVNLRVATHAQNMRNQRIKAGRLRGVASNHKRWKADIEVDGVRKYLGTYDTREEAARAYDAAACLYHGEFAALNYPEAANPVPSEVR